MIQLIGLEKNHRSSQSVKGLSLSLNFDPSFGTMAKSGLKPFARDAPRCYPPPSKSHLCTRAVADWVTDSWTPA